MKGFRVALCVPLFLLGDVVTGSTAGAAEEVGLGVAYDVRAPAGSFRSVIPDVGYAGIQAKWDYFPLDELSIGVDIQYNQFRRRPTVPDADGSPTPPAYHNVGFWSFLQTARYYFSSSALRPYAELGAGLSTATGATLVDDLSRRNAVTGLVVQPSIGVLLRFSEDDRVRSSTNDEREAGLLDLGLRRRPPRESMFGVTASLTYAFTTTEVGGARNVGFVGFQLGIYAKP
ncbi:MAG: hypothetical protein QOI41_1280 [Myxococcales bacterium]|nr:hypothetical protein [Myxococcales bacterium]